MLLLIVLLLLNFGISILNAHVTGKVWAESKALGGWVRLLAWCGAIQSACGFTMVYGVVLGLIFLPATAFAGLMGLIYLMIIIPVIATGTIIMIESWIRVYRERSLGFMAEAGWNTFANGYNIYSALDGGFSGALKAVGGLLDGDGDDAWFGLVLVLGAISLGAGVLTTYGIMQRSMGSLPLPERV